MHLIYILLISKVENVSFYTVRLTINFKRIPLAIKIKERLHLPHRELPLSLLGLIFLCIRFYIKTTGSALAQEAFDVDINDRNQEKMIT